MKSFFAVLLGLIMCAAPGALASVSVNVNGSAYTIPQNNEKGWGTAVTSWIQAMSQYTLQANGGAFTLTAETDFGATYGLKGPYFKTETSTPATVGVLRLASTDAVDWRNNANSANNALSVDGSDNLLYNGNKLLSGGLGSIVNADISNSAAITRSKLATGTINQVVINDGSGNLSSEATLAISRGGTALSAVGTANQLFGTNSGATAYEAKGVTVTSAGTLTIPTGQVGLLPNGTVSAPSLAFTNDTGSGLYRIGALDLGIASGGVLGIDILENSGFVTFGYGTPANTNVDYPGTWSITDNADVYWTMQNKSTGTSSSANFVFQAGTSAGEFLGLSSFRDSYITNTYLQETSQVHAAFNQLALVLGSDYASGKILFDIGTASTAHEYASLTTTALTLEHGDALIMNGSGSGAITVQTQAAAGTYNFNLPTTAGTSGYALTSAGGGSSVMTWSPILTNPSSAAYDTIYQNAGNTAFTNLANGTTGQVYMATTSAAPSWATVKGNTTILKAPTLQTFTSTGTQTGVVFTITSGNATVGATYTNNGHTYTVLGTIAAETVLFTSGTGATSGGTLTKSGGTGDATITFSLATSLATYTLPTNPSPIYIRVKMAGAGGGGAGGGTSAATNGGSGSRTYFSTGFVAGGGGAGTWDGGASTGGAVVKNSGGAGGFAIAGSGGQGASGEGGSINLASVGGQGGATTIGGAGAGGGPAGAGQQASTNSGSGGGGGGSTSSGASIVDSGAGGAAGAYFDQVITSPAATYPYAVGTAGGGGSAGTAGGAGGQGADGQIIIEEFYQ